MGNERERQQTIFDVLGQPIGEITLVDVTPEGLKKECAYSKPMPVAPTGANKNESHPFPDKKWNLQDICAEAAKKMAASKMMELRRNRMGLYVPVKNKRQIMGNSAFRKLFAEADRYLREDVGLGFALFRDWRQGQIMGLSRQITPMNPDGTYQALVCPRIPARVRCTTDKKFYWIIALGTSNPTSGSIISL